MGDMVVILMIVIGVMLGFIRKTIRLLMSIIIAAVAIAFTPALYDRLGFYFASFGLDRHMGDGLGFFLAGLLLLVIFEFIFRWAFKETSLPRLRVLDRILGALLGLAWGLFAAGLFLAALVYLGAVPASDPGGLAVVSRSLFRAFVRLLHFIYPPGSVPIIEW